MQSWAPSTVDSLQPCRLRLPTKGASYRSRVRNPVVRGWSSDRPDGIIRGCGTNPVAARRRRQMSWTAWSPARGPCSTRTGWGHRRSPPGPCIHPVELGLGVHRHRSRPLRRGRAHARNSARCSARSGRTACSPNIMLTRASAGSRSFRLPRSGGRWRVRPTPRGASRRGHHPAADPCACRAGGAPAGRGVDGSRSSWLAVSAPVPCNLATSRTSAIRPGSA